MPGIGAGFWFLSDLRELSFWSPCGTCFFIKRYFFGFMVHISEERSNKYNQKSKKFASMMILNQHVSEILKDSKLKKNRERIFNN